MEKYPFKHIPNFIETLNENGINLSKIIKQEIKFNYDIIEVLQHGKKVIVKEQRGTCWLSNKNLPFMYSGKIMIPLKIPKTILDIKLKIEEEIKKEFDGVLVNYYPNGNISMGYHSDPIEDKWDNNFVILSLGDSRDFIFREKLHKNNKIKFNFNNGDLIYMFDNCQELYQHSVRKNKDSNAERISLVFKKSI